MEKTAREVVANRMLIKNAKIYKFTKEDIEEIQNNLKFWEKDFIKKVGVPYEESEIDRRI